MHSRTHGKRLRHRSARWAGSLFLFFLVLAAPASAQPANGGPVVKLDTDAIRQLQASSAGMGEDAEGTHPFATHFQQIAAAYRAGQAQEVASAASSLQDYSVQTGLVPADSFAMGFAHLFLAASRQPDGIAGENAVACLQAATKFSEDAPYSDFALAEAQFAASGPKGLVSEGGIRYFGGLSKLRNNAYWRIFAAHNIAHAAFWAAFFLLTGFAVLMAVRYNGLFRHDAWEILHVRLGDRLARLVVWAAFLAPMALCLSGLWLILFWCAILFPYMKKAERVMCTLFLVIFGATMPLQHIFLTRSMAALSPMGQALYRAQRGITDPSADGQLVEVRAQLQEANPEAVDLLDVLQAERDIKTGHVQRARNELQRMLDSGTRYASDVHLLLGNIYIGSGDADDSGFALNEYTLAHEADARNAEAVWNMQYVFQEKFQIPERDAARRDALAIRPSLGDLERLHPEKDKLLAWPHITADQVLRVANELTLSDPHSAISHLGFDLNRPAGAWVGVVFIASILSLIAGIVLTFLRGQQARGCTKCGRHFCMRCKNSKDFPAFCTQCEHIYVRKDGVLPEARIAKNYEVEEYQRKQLWIQRISGAVIPGGGAGPEESLMLGLPAMVLWSILLAGVAARSGFLPLPFPPTPAIDDVMGKVLAFMLILYWASMALKSMLRKA